MMMMMMIIGPTNYSAVYVHV